MPRIVVLDGHTLNPGDNPWDALAALGDLTVHDRTPPELVVERARDAEIVLTNKTRLGAVAIAQLPALRYVGVLATGFDVVDAEAARARGIPVTNVPEYGTDSVAQHVFALLLELCHATAEHDAAVHAGEWQRSPDFSFSHRPPIELVGLTIGIVGYGRIGRRVGAIARAFGMHVMTAGRGDAPGPVFAAADVVSLHCPLTTATAGLVDRARLETMKRTAFLVNVARGGLVVEADLADALDRGIIAGAAVDVVSHEPIDPANPLLRARHCVITPHLAWASLAARRRLTATAVENVRAWLAGRPINVVNP